MSELPVPSATPPEPPRPQTYTCANCGAELSGEYCAACGQRHEPHIHSVAHFAGEAFESISHADSRLWRTLWYLFSRPGFLTREFFAGRRVAYLPPFRLYLVLSVLFFSTLGLGGGESTASVEIDGPGSAEDVAALNGVADLVATNPSGAMSQEQAAAVSRQLRAIANETATEAASNSAADRGTAAAVKEAERAAKDAAGTLMTGDSVNDGITKFCEDFRA